MTKAELVAAVAEATGEEESELEHILDETISAMTGALAAGGVVELSPLGRFIPRDESAHQGSDPNLHTPIEIPAQRRILFHAASELRSAVQPAAGGGEEQPPAPGA